MTSSFQIVYPRTSTAWYGRHPCSIGSTSRHGHSFPWCFPIDALDIDLCALLGTGGGVVQEREHSIALVKVLAHSLV